MTNYKKIFSILLSLSIVLSGCGARTEKIESKMFEETLTNITESVAEAPAHTEPLDIDDDVREYKSLNDPQLLQYVQDSISAELAGELASDDYIIDTVSAIYYSKEYLDEIEYNSRANIFFGFTIDELNKQFEGTRYVFTLSETGETMVEPLKELYDDTFARVIKNVAIGTGVILICVTVSVVSAAVGAEPISMVFAASAKKATTLALEAGLFAAIAAGSIKGIQTGDFDQIKKAALLSGSEAFKWGAIVGAISGGIEEASTLRNAAQTAKAAERATKAIDKIPTWKDSELAALQKYGGSDQITFLNGKQVPWGTAGGTRPDVWRQIGDHFEAIEVKNYDLSSSSGRSELYRELIREVGDRLVHLPLGSTQRIVLDVTGRGFSPELIDRVVQTILEKLLNIYPNIPIDIMGV